MQESADGFLSDADLQAIVAPVLEAAPVGSRWLHRKGGKYVVEMIVIGEGGQLPIVVYRPDREGAVSWARLATQFLDGRFERIDG